jgi:prenylcysteine oxidase/farnesylcysteine lyase
MRIERGEGCAGSHLPPEYFASDGVRKETRLIQQYARDMSDIHALGAAVSMASSGAKSILGGNWQIFDRMLHNASATVVLGTQVTDILPFISDTGTPQFQLRTNTSLFTNDAPFDSIIFAAPWHLSPIARSMEHYFTETIPEQKYVRLHVTLLVTSKQRPEAAFFGQGVKEGTVLPNTILTSGYDARAHRNATSAYASGDDGRPSFQSISWHGETTPGSGEYVVKIFSLSSLSDEYLYTLIDEEPRWVLRKEWDSYPKLGPIKSYAPVEPYRGFHYLAALEPWVST